MDLYSENTLSIFLMIRSAHCTAAATTAAATTGRVYRTFEFSHPRNHQRVEFTASELLREIDVGVNMTMTMTVVRCPYCLSDDEFRPMVAVGDGRFACGKC